MSDLTYRSAIRAEVEKAMRPDTERMLATIHYSDPAPTYKEIRTSSDHPQILHHNFGGLGGAKDVQSVVYTTEFLDGEHTFRLQVGDRVRFTDLSSANVGDHLDKRASHTATVTRLLLAVCHDQNDPIGGYVKITNVVPRSPKSDIHTQVHPISRFAPVEEVPFEWDQALADAFRAASRPTVMVQDIKYPSVRTKLSKFAARDGRLLSGRHLSGQGYDPSQAPAPGLELRSAKILNSCGLEEGAEPRPTEFHLDQHVVLLEHVSRNTSAYVHHAIITKMVVEKNLLQVGVGAQPSLQGPRVRATLSACNEDGQILDGSRSKTRDLGRCIPISVLHAPAVESGEPDAQLPGPSHS